MDGEALLFVILIDALILIPALIYLIEGRRYRRQMILAYFSPDVVCDYFRQFWSGNSRFSELIQKYRDAFENAKHLGGTEEEKQARAKEKSSAEIALNDRFRELYDDRYGWLKYFMPLVVLGFVLTVEARFIAQFAELLLAKNAQALTGTAVDGSLLKSLVRLPDKVTVAAIAGAYLAVGLDLFRRVSSLILLPGDLWFYALRLMVAPILGFAIGSFASADAAMVAAFTITVLPIGDMLQWIRAKTAKAVGVEERPEEARDKPIKLPGVDSVVAARLEDQGISTIAQLCEVDPVLLSMRTGYDFTYIVRLVDVAIAWRYFNDKLPGLSCYGWTGASAILSPAGGTGSGAATPEEETRYQTAFMEWQTAKKTSEADLANAKLADAEKAAKSKFDAARVALKDALQYQFNKDLILEIGKSENKFGLAAVGIENVVRQINNDGYARFIDGLLRSSAGKSMPKKPETFWGKVMNLFGSTGD